MSTVLALACTWRYAGRRRRWLLRTNGRSYMKLNFGNRISAQSWARVEAALPRQGYLGPHSAVPGELEIDLSAVGFADFVALGRILLLVDDLATHGSTVRVHLPSTQPLERELSHLRIADTSSESGAAVASRLALRLRQRLTCRLFLRSTGFEACLKSGHWNPLQVTLGEKPAREKLPPDPLPTIDEDLHETIQPPSTRRRLLPFKWMASEMHANDAVSETASIVKALTAIGLPHDDAELLAYGLISELLENSRMHSWQTPETPRLPLFGAAIVDASAYERRIDDFDINLRSLAASAAVAGSRLVRIFVGDSGRGIEVPEHETIGAEPNLGDPVDQNVEAIVRAMSRWKPSRHSELSARGLWKVQRIVQEYGGSALIRSGRAQAGYIYHTVGPPEPIQSTFQAILPGTAIECNLLTTQKRHRRRRAGELASPIARRSAFTQLRLQCTSALLRPGRGLDELDTQRIREVVQSPKSDSGGIVVAIEVAQGSGILGDDDLIKLIRSISDIVAEGNRPPTVTLAIAGANRSMLALAIEELNIGHDATADPGLTGPILVIAEGVHYWVGGNSSLRDILGSLSQDQPQLRLVRGGTTIRGDPEDVLLRVDAVRSLLDYDGATIRLKLRPQDALQAIASYLRGVVSSAISEVSADGVESGEFLTPSLRRTTRWIDVRRLLASARCLNLSSLVLAFLVFERTGRYLVGHPNPFVIWRAGSMTRDMTGAFQASLDGVSQEYRAPVEVAAETPTSSAGPKPVVICTDLISTEHSIRMAIEDVLSAAGTPVAIAAFVDVRDDPRNEIEVAGLRIPIVRLTGASIASTAEHLSDDELTIIDPLLGEPLARPPVYSWAMKVQQNYIKALESAEAARLGHIVRPAGRHYTAYVDPTMLYANEGWRHLAVSAMMRRIKDGRTDAELTDADGVCILYPSRTRDKISVVAELLEEALRLAEMEVCGVIQVPRAPASGGWRYPASIRLPNGTAQVVVIDSGSRSGRTVRQLMRLSSEEGVRVITAIVLANGMEEADALALQQTRAIEEPTNPRRSVRHNISVEVNFLTRTAVAARSAEQCTICQLRNSYASISQHLPPLLAEHRDYLLRALDEKTKDDVFEAGTSDLFGAAIEQRDCVAYLSWRAGLRDSLFSTTDRRKLANEVRRLHESGIRQEGSLQETRQRDALIRVLAAELSWIDAEPLSFSDICDALTGIAEAVLLSTPASAADPMLRVQAATVLAGADPRRFAREIGNILKRSIDHHLVVVHVLMEALKLLNNKNAQTSIIEDVARNISVIADLQPTTPAGLRATTSDVSKELRFVASLARMKLPSAPASRQRYWRT